MKENSQCCIHTTDRLSYNSNLIDLNNYNNFGLNKKDANAANAANAAIER